jgi:hypothetical protein
VIVGDPVVVDIRVDDDRSVLVEPLSRARPISFSSMRRGIVTANVRILVCGVSPSNGCVAGHSS